MRYLLIMPVFAMALCSCQKKDTTVSDPAKAVINIASPLANHNYHSGDSVHVSATVTYPGELHGYEVKVTDTVSGYIIYDNAQHLHDDHFDINLAYLASGNSAQILKLELITDIDHNGTEARSTLYFNYTP